MKVVIIGSVAAGTSVGAKLRRSSEDIEIKIFDKDSDISYSSCGIPYYIGDEEIERDNLTPRDAKWFKGRFNIDISTNHEVMEIIKEKKEIVVKNLLTKDIIRETYDKLVLATGSIPKKLNIPSDNSLEIFKVKDIKDADRILKVSKKSKKAIVIGGGYIGLEMVDNFVKLGLEVVLVEKSDRLSGNLDREMAKYVENHLKKKGIKIYLNSNIEKISEKKLYLEGGEGVEGDFIVSAIGVEANTFLGKMINIDTGINESYVVDENMETSISDIYAVGDCAQTYHRLTGEEVYIPLGSTANKMGRILGDRLTGGKLEFKGVLGTGIYKTLDLVVARTGLGEEKALSLGYEVEVIHNIKPNKSQYLADSREMVIKGICEKESGRLLGAQIVGYEGVDKAIDTFVTAITYGGVAEDLFSLDLAYAPPFNTTKSPVAYTGMVLANGISGKNKILTSKELLKNRDEYIVIDVRSNKQYLEGHIEGAINMPLKSIRERYNELDREKTYVVHCNKGVSGNAAQNILLNLGFEKVYNLSGGYKQYRVEVID